MEHCQPAVPINVKWLPISQIMALVVAQLMWEVQSSSKETLDFLSHALQNKTRLLECCSTHAETGEDGREWGGRGGTRNATSSAYLGGQNGSTAGQGRDKGWGRPPGGGPSGCQPSTDSRTAQRTQTWTWRILRAGGKARAEIFGGQSGSQKMTEGRLSKLSPSRAFPSHT